MAVEFEMPDYSRVAKHIRDMKPRALTAAQYDDVIQLIEWMQQQLVLKEDHVTAREQAVEAREKAVQERERDVAVRQRVVSAAAGLGARTGWRRYLKG